MVIQLKKKNCHSWVNRESNENYQLPPLGIPNNFLLSLALSLFLFPFHFLSFCLAQWTSIDFLHVHTETKPGSRKYFVPTTLGQSQVTLHGHLPFEWCVALTYITHMGLRNRLFCIMHARSHAQTLLYAIILSCTGSYTLHDMTCMSSPSMQSCWCHTWDLTPIICWLTCIGSNVHYMLSYMHKVSCTLYVQSHVWALGTCYVRSCVWALIYVMSHAWSLLYIKCRIACTDSHIHYILSHCHRLSHALHAGSHAWTLMSITCQVMCSHVHYLQNPRRTLPSLSTSLSELMKFLLPHCGGFRPSDHSWTLTQFPLWSLWPGMPQQTKGVLWAQRQAPVHGSGRWGDSFHRFPQLPFKCDSRNPCPHIPLAGWFQQVSFLSNTAEYQYFPS